MGSLELSAGNRRSGLALSWWWLRLVCLFGLGAVMVLSAAGKLARPRAFVRAVAEYRMLPLWADRAVAAMLPGVELVAGVLLLAGFLATLSRISPYPAPAGDPRAAKLRAFESWVAGAGWVAGGLLVVFIAGMLVAMARGLQLDCGCFDLMGDKVPLLKSDRVGWGTVGRDVVMAVMALPIVVRWRGAR